MTEPTYDIRFGDCVPGMAELPADSINLCVTSIPFADLFQYSAKNEDIGNCAAGVDLRETEFAIHTRFMIEQLLRVLEPGAVAAIHIQQLRATKVQHGFMGRRDFRGATVDLFCAGGFDWTGEFVIPKDPQRIAQTQKLHSLQFRMARTDARVLAPAINDYVMLFRKPGEGGTPVPALYDRDRNPDGWITAEDWIRDAHGTWSGVWDDIHEIDILDGFKSAREEDDEKHVCPLQLTVIRRLIQLYSNPGGTVLDPFMGIGSTAFVAIEQGRNAVGFELKESYYQQAIRNSEKALERRRQRLAPLPLFAGLLGEKAAV